MSSAGFQGNAKFGCQGLAASQSVFSGPTRQSNNSNFEDSTPLYSSKTVFCTPSDLPRPSSTWTKVLTWTWQAISLLIPVSFLIIAGLSHFLDGKLISSYPFGQNILSVTGSGVTLYPLAFTAIVGQTIQKAVTYLASRGTKLYLLEQLQHSTTISGAFTTQWFLRIKNTKFWLVAISLMSIWILSPLGGQAVLRVLSTGTLPDINLGTMYIFNTSSVGVKSYLTNDAFAAETSSIFFSSLIAPQSIQESPMDSWGNVKAPVLESLSAVPDSDGWYDIPEEDVDYSSLLGMPITGIPEVGNTNFSMVSSYFYLVCSKPNCLPLSDEFLWQSTNDTFCSTNSSQLLGSTSLVNNTQSTTCSVGTVSLTASVNLSSNTTRQIIFQSELNTVCITQTVCDVHYSTVENNIACNDKSCQVTRQRPYTQFPTNVSPLDECTTARNFYLSFAGACGPFHGVLFPQPSSLEIYLMTGLSPLSVGADGNSMHNMSNLTAGQMSQRLTRLVNTFFLSSVAPEYIAGGMNTFNFSDPRYPPIHPGTVILVDVATDEDVFVCDYLWLGVLVVSAMVLLFIAIGGGWLKYMNIAPDIFGYISTLTMGNTYFGQGEHGSTLDGFERARAMGDVNVKLGDVRPMENVGLVVFASLDEAITVVEILKKGRMYL